MVEEPARTCRQRSLTYPHSPSIPTHGTVLHCELLRSKEMASSRGRWASPERTVVWTEPPPKSTARRAPAQQQEKTAAKVAVVYYLSRNGQLDHPHFMEVALSSPQHGLTLRDVLDRLAVLRGAGMADAYSWSSKRSYRNGYVWHDLTADDPVHPANGNEYVLKGSELLVLPPLPVRPRDASASSSSSTSSFHGDSNKTTPAASGRTARRKNWSSFDLGEYRVAAVRGAEMLAADAATQTDESRRGGRRRNVALPEQEAARTELGVDEISPPPSSGSPDDTLETLIKNDVRVAAAAVAPQCEDVAAQGVIAGGRTRASAVLMQLISCGSIPAAPKQDRPRYAGERRFPRGRSDLSSSSSSTVGDGFSGSIGVGVGMEREYFSGSLVETKKTASNNRAGDGELGALKRSSSYNADRARDMNMMNATITGCSKLELAAEEEVVGAPRARCIPAAARRPNNGSSKKSPANHVQVTSSSSRRRNQPEAAALTEEEEN